MIPNCKFDVLGHVLFNSDNKNLASYYIKSGHLPLEILTQVAIHAFHAFTFGASMQRDHNLSSFHYSDSSFLITTRI